MVPRMTILLLIIALPSIILAKENGGDSSSGISGQINKVVKKAKSALSNTESSITQATSNVEKKIEDFTSGVEEKAGSIESDIGSVIEPANSKAFEEAVEDPDPTTAPPATTISENDIQTGRTTKGLLIVLEEFLHPFAMLFYQFLDAFLRNAEDRALPCIVTSWMPLRGKCSRIE